MIVTVTPNPALDSTWTVTQMIVGESHRSEIGTIRAGGKGINVARVLHAEGHEVLTIATSGGATGVEFEHDLTASGIQYRLVNVTGPTRRSVAIVDRESGEATVVNEYGATLNEHEVRDLLVAAQSEAEAARVVVVSGSLPPGFEESDLAALVRSCTEQGVPTIIDTSGPSILAAARAGATILKPNALELAEATGLANPAAAAQSLLDAGAQLVVVSLGAEGMILLHRAQPSTLLRARLPEPLHGNPTGAGDAAVAAFAAGLAELPHRTASPRFTADVLESMARAAVGWSASAVLMPLAGELSPRHHELAESVIISREQWR